MYPYPHSGSNPSPLQLFPAPEIIDDVCAEFYRVSGVFRSAFAKKFKKDSDIEVLDPTQMFGINGMCVSSPSPPVTSPRVAVVSPEVEGRVAVRRPTSKRSSKLFRANDLPVEEQRRFRSSVKKTRMIYESYRLFMVEENDGRPREAGRRSRVDLGAAGVMKDLELWLNRDKRIVGTIPGVYVGDIFVYRMEMCVIGLHGQIQAGIDYVPSSQSLNGDTIATSVVVSGGYEDDEDSESGDVIIYTGQGGQARNSLRQCVDQKLEGGNLALQKSMLYGIEIRVIRGIKDDRVSTGKIYVYDGLYRVEEKWFDFGKSGFRVYKFKLVRIPGQPEIGSSIFKFAAELRRSPLSVRPSGYLSLDISKGKEKDSPILLFNDIDSNADPLQFEYLVKTSCPLTLPLGNGMGCDCAYSCSNNCHCVQKNGGELAYDKNGILLRGKPVIFECGRFCRCSANCKNRVSQRGLKHRLEIFRSRETGWGVRPLGMILAGEFICEFAGVVLTRQQAAILSMNGDSLVYPNRFPERWKEWGDISQVFPEYQRPTFPSIPPLDFAMDVSRMRNVACYISHSSTPNVLVQFVLYDHHNIMYPHLMLFAMENIPPLRELSLDYGVADEWTGKLAICN
ncbi:hypothetical protein GIB67_024642 [Kingdonia uniflora]|uniref:Uncharacterized protein n=1 Tax=Kingdonia uniflora TaxID=39325 RepID=A0A7J7LP23_9MAGN|nr:hypothetical protein GIB67_024642 [Kingdonia uniflora]